MNIAEQQHVWSNTHRFGLATVLAIQLAIAYVIGAGGLLANTQASVIPPIAMTVVIPVALFLAAYVLSARFRDFVLAQDIRTLTMMQHWRVIGSVFLVLYSFDILPALFAFPAGLGDVAIGLAAMFVISRMDRDPDYLRSNGYLWFHLLGLLDFIAALGTAALSSGAFPNLISNGLTSAAMDVWPLNIFPSLIVPSFIILHLSALLKLRDMRHRQPAPSTNPISASLTL